MIEKNLSGDVNETATLEARPSWGRRLIGIEGLRGLAAIGVLIAHVHIHLAATLQVKPVGLIVGILGQGLTLFFVLSGFLLYRPFADAIASGDHIVNIRRFFINRALRIYPGYLAILFLVSLVFGAAYTSAIPEGQTIANSKSTVGYMTDPLLLVTNALMIHTLFPATIKTGIGPSWSLTVELLFYIVLPVISLLTFRAAKNLAPIKRAMATFAPAIFIICLGIGGKLLCHFLIRPTSPAEEVFFNWGASWQAVFSRSFLVQADLFAPGMITAAILVLLNKGSIPQNYIALIRRGSWVLLVTAVVFSRIVSAKSCWALASGCLVLLVALPTSRGHHGWLSNLLETPVLKFLGLISYSMYLWHVPVIWLTHKYGFAQPATIQGFLYNIILVVTVTIILSTVTYFAAEAPPMRLKRRTDS